MTKQEEQEKQTLEQVNRCVGIANEMSQHLLGHDLSTAISALAIIVEHFVRLTDLTIEGFLQQVTDLHNARMTAQGEQGALSVAKKVQS